MSSTPDSDAYLTAEARARVEIDRQLVEAGWIVQPASTVNLSAGPGVAVREFVLSKPHGRADYLLFVDRVPVGAIEAKPKGTTLTEVERQSSKYSEGLPWSNAEVAVLRRLAERHQTALEIAIRMSRSSAGIQNKAFSLGIRFGKPRKPREAWAPQDDARLRELANAKITKSAACHMMGRDLGTLRHHLRALDLTWQGPIRPPQAPRPAPRARRDPRVVADQLQWLADHGWSEGMAALELGIADTKAWRLSREYGIEWRVRNRSVKGSPLPI